MTRARAAGGGRLGGRWAATETCVGIGPLGAEVGALRFAPALTPYTRVGLCY